MSVKESNLVLLQLALAFFIKSTSSQDVLLNLNTKKVAAVTSDKFLSLTLDPAVLLAGDVLASSTEVSTNMAKALAPGYVRLAGPRSNSYTFERSLFPQTGYEDPDLMFSEAHWVLVQQWAQRSGLEVVSSLNPLRIENEDQATTWDPRNSLELISFSDHMGYNISWQLGYECQTRCDISGFDFGKDVARLRNMLGAFPRYANSIIAGPDIVSFRGKQQHQYIQDYLNGAGNALSVLTWHPDFAGITLDSDGVALQIDTLAADKDMLYKAMGRSVSKKPLWIAESKPEECKRQFLGALVWARRLGNAAKLGVQVIMRQPDASNMFLPTPDYWVSLLHKMLVGREVLDTKLSAGNKTHLHFYCQCTKPSAKYDRGAVTIFGINLTPSKVSVSLKGLKIKAIHKYILMPGHDTDNRMFAETVLLNNEPLTLVNGKNLPEINPSVSLMGKNMAVRLPSGGIGFWVIPGARVKSCLGHDEENGDKNLLLKKLTKKLEEPEVGDENLGHELEEDNRNQDFDVESAEDIKSLLKSKKKKRKYRHSDEADDEDRRFKRIDTKKELEKLEKLLKRNSNNEEKKPSPFKGRVGLAMFDSEANESGENTKGENISEEEAGLVRFKKNDKSNSGEEIRTKLEEYKNKLIEYETRKKNDEKSQGFYLRTISQPDERFSNDVDTQKAVEALGLISRVESAMREYGTSNEKIKYRGEPRNLQPLNLASDIGEEMLIEELEKPDKIKRMIDLKSLGKVHPFFLTNSRDKIHKRSVENFDEGARDKRDLEKLLSDDPLGLRKDGLFKKRLKNDEAKERRLERRNRKRDKEDIGIRKELPVGRYDPRITDSNENNFFGFPEMKPLENFPQGDVFFSEGSSSEEKSRDYDYVKDDDDEEATQQQKKRGKNRRGKKNRQNNRMVQDDDTWVEEPNSNLNYAPNEFFEKLNLPTVAIKTQWKDHGELYEPESLQQQGDFKEEQKIQDNDNVGDTVMASEHIDEREDKRAKETTVKKLINYYDNSEVLRTNRENSERQKKRPTILRKEPISRAETPIKRKMKESVKAKPEEIVQEENSKRLLQLDNEYEDSADLGSLEFVNSKEGEDYSEDSYENDEILAKKRPKRKIANLDFDVFGQEMIREDAGNSRDCKCRVIRSTGKIICKNCRKIQRRQRDLTETDPEEEAAVIDPISTTITDQNLTPIESTIEDVIADTNDVPEISQGETADQETSPALGDVVSFQKNTEVDDLNRDVDGSIPSTDYIDDKKIEDSYTEFTNEEGLALESSSPLTEDGNSQIIDVTEAAEPEIDFHNGDTETDKSTDDLVGSQRFIENGKEYEAANQGLDESISDAKSSTDIVQDVKEEKEAINIEKNNNGEYISEDNHAKRHIDEIPDVNSNAQSSTKFSLSTGVSLGSSVKTESDEGKFKLKSSGLKTDSGRSKLALNTEALSALIKESENKKAEVIKALESSARLKSVDNSKYLEYQRKRAEKLANLKEKLRERKARVLQQYRQELLDALSKCDDEVERNLKRREIWDNFSNQKEFDEFVDKDKLAYIMMHRPIDYENNLEQNDNGFSSTEDRRYYPKIDEIQPYRSPRERKIPANDYRRYFYAPKRAQFSSSSMESSFDSSAENSEPYYAIVESLENPKIYHKKNFDDLQNAYGNKYNGLSKQRISESEEIDFDDEKYLKKDRFVPKKYTDTKFYQKPVQQGFDFDGTAYDERDPALHIYGEDLSPKYAMVSHYNEFPERERNLLQKNYKQEAPGVQNTRYSKENDEDSWDSSIPENYDGILHHRQYLGPNYSGSRQKLLGIKEVENDRRFYDPEEFAYPKRSAIINRMKNNQDETFGKDIGEIPLHDGWRILKKFESPCSDGSCDGKNNFANTKELDESQIYYEGPREDQVAFNDGTRLVRTERHLTPHEKQVLEEPAYKIIPVDPRSDSTARRERDIKEKQSNYVCLREDSKEDSREDEKRIFKLVRNEDHYEAVPIPEIPEDIGADRGRKNHRRVAKQSEKVRNKRRKYSTDFLTDEELNYYVKNGGYLRKNLPKIKYCEDRELTSQNRENNLKNKFNYEFGEKSDSGYDEIDYRSIGDEINRLNLGPRLSPEEYELLMLIPVKKHKVKRQRRDLQDNGIDRSESDEDVNEVWSDMEDAKENEKRLQDYINAREKSLSDFEEAQANLNKYLKKLETVKDPMQIEKFKKVILNLGSHDQDEMTMIAQSDDDLDRIHLEEYLKQEILKKVDSNGAEKIDETSTTPVPETSTTLFDVAIPKLENTINEELEKVGKLTESLEDFINDFDKKFNSTSDTESDETGSKIPNDNKTYSYNIFHTAVNNVKKFFDFLAGVSLIFRRY